MEVHLRFDGRWVAGFEMAEERGDGPDRQVWLRRRSDGAMLPDPFPAVDVRPVTPVSPAPPRSGIPRAG